MTTLALSETPRRLGNMALTALLVAAVAILVVGALISVFSGSSDHIGWDLRTGYLPAADAVREGVSPYPDPADPEPPDSDRGRRQSDRQPGKRTYASCDRCLLSWRRLPFSLKAVPRRYRERRRNTTV